MKHVPTELLRLKTWKDLPPLIDESATFTQKVAQISDILRRFPGRSFILVGDSGEKDPEIYREIKRKFPVSVLEIYIRDVRCDERSNPSRLKGMIPIPIPECRQLCSSGDSAYLPFRRLADLDYPLHRS